MMRLWTIQSGLFYERLCKEGSITCKPSLSEWLAQGPGMFMPAYDWMAEQMRRRVGEPPKGVHYPIWAWYAVRGGNQRPDLRWAEFRNYDEDQVCIEVEIPDVEALLSDEEAWHIVLNGGYNCLGENIDAEYAWYEQLTEEERRRVRLESWERIFDVFNPKEPVLHIQGVFWQLRFDQVRGVRPIKGKRKKQRQEFYA